jgi:lipid-binding SYLF domain-containing protein
MLLCVATTAFALDPAQLDNRVRSLTERFEEFQHSGKAIPANILSQAQGIVLLDRTKAGFLFAYQGGGGIATVKDPATGKWSPVAFLDANQASLGFQIGGEQTFYAILLMTTNAAQMLTNPSIDLGGEARGTAGNATSGVQTTTPLSASVLVYDDRQGLYAGAALKAGALTPDDQANQAYYGQYVTMGDILFGHKVQRTEAANILAHQIHAYSANPNTAER